MRRRRCSSLPSRLGKARVDEDLLAGCMPVVIVKRRCFVKGEKEFPLFHFFRGRVTYRDLVHAGLRLWIEAL